MNTIVKPLKRWQPILGLFFLILSGWNVALAQTCPTPPTPDTNWIATWTDQFNQTTYTLTAPCKVFINVPFDITASVTDTTHTLESVAFLWSIEDNGTVIAGGGFNWLDVDDTGQWQLSVTPTYTGTPIDHQIEFKFTDLGKGAGAHWWGSSVIGSITVDPFLPASAPPVLLADIQTMRNETGTPPSSPSTPWLTTAINNVTAAGAQLALERSEVAGQPIVTPETVGYIAIEADKLGAFTDNLGNTINYETRNTPNSFTGWRNQCVTIPLLGNYKKIPLVIASKISHDDINGGWLRRCGLNTTNVGFVVDEDQYRDTERSHSAEKASLVAFSEAFDATFTDSESTWGMEAAQVTLPNSSITRVFTTVTFRQVYSTPPVVTVLATSSGKDPSALRIRNVTTMGFEIAQVEPLGEDGPHSSMAIDYLAVEMGTHFLPDNTRIVVDTAETTAQQHGDGLLGSTNWDNVTF